MKIIPKKAPMNWNNSMRLASAVVALLTVLSVWSCSKEATPAAPAPATQPSTLPAEPTPGSHPMGPGMQHPTGPGGRGMGMEGHAMLPDGGPGHR